MIRLIQRRLIIPRGDTGTFSVPVLSTLNTGDVAIFTIFDDMLKRKVFEKRIENITDTIDVRFEHEDTVNLPVGKFYWDIKFYKNPVFIDDELVDGEEVDSYYAAFTLPVCEIRQTGDKLITADGSPTTTLNPETIHYINAAISDIQEDRNVVEAATTEITEAAEAASTNATNAAAAKEDAIAAANQSAANRDEARGYASNAYNSSLNARESANRILNLNAAAVTLASNNDATASYNSQTGILTIGVPRGRSIQSATLNQDYTLTLLYDSGLSDTVGPIRGEKGDDYILTAQDKADIAALVNFPVTSVANKTGDVTLNGNDIAYSVVASYDNNTIGKVLQLTQENIFSLQQDVDNLGGDNIHLDSTDVESETIGEAISNLKTSKVDKDALDNAGITARTYTELFGGEFTVTTAETSGWKSPYARASVTGRIAKEYLHRVTVNYTEYVLPTRLWFETDENTSTMKVYEYLGNLALYINDTSGVPGGTDNVPFIIISDLDDNSSIDVLTNATGTYTILVERITPTEVELPKSLIYGDEYSPIEKNNNGGTYNGFSLGVNELSNKRGTFALGYGNMITQQFGVAIGLCNKSSGNVSFVEGNRNIASGNFAHAEGNGTTASGHYSHAEGADTIASSAYAHAEGYGTTASGEFSHAEGYNTNATNTYAHAEGYWTTASANGTHAEGYNTTASLLNAHAEGQNTIASGQATHVEGRNTQASAAGAHAEGNRTVASGTDSHAEGRRTIANHLCQHVFGEANIADTSSDAYTARGTYVEIVGNGTADDARSNARTLDWSGNERLAGSLTLGADTQAEVTLTANKLGEVINYDTVIAPRESDLSAASQAYAIGDVFMANGKLCVATAAIALGDTINIGTNCEYTSVAAKFVKNTDIASANNYGVIKVKPGGGTNLDSTDKTLILHPANINYIRAANAAYMPITPIHQHESTFYGLAKAAGDTTQSQSYNAVGNYTESAKDAIQKMLGVYEAPWELIREDTFTNAEEAHHEITLDSEGNTFELTDAIIMFETPKQDTYAAKGAYGQIEFYYGNGSGNKYTSESGAWTQEANGSAHGFVAIYEQKNGLISLSFTANTTSSNRSNISYRYSAGFPSEGAQTISIPDSSTYPRNIIKIKITAVTGTGHYKLYGKRKWTT